MTEAAIAVVEGENELDVTEAADPSHLSPEAIAAQETFLQSMKTICCNYNENVQIQQKTHELRGGETLAESVDPLLCDSLYNVHLQQNPEFRTADMTCLM